MNSYFFNLSIIELIVFGAFTLFFLIQILYYCILFLRVAFYKHKNEQIHDVSQDGISIVICARNESDNLQKYLPKILEQGHPAFEVIVVNNYSTDDSDDTLTLLQTTYPHLVVRNIGNDELFARNSAMAWGVGIKAARYEWILLTDAGSNPENEHWLATLQQNFTKDTAVVLSYTHNTGSAKVVRAEIFFDALHYLGKALIRHPYTGCAGNLAFRKSSFFEHKGFHTQLKLHDNADRVFINTVAQRNNTKVDLSPNAINSSALKLSFSESQLNWRDTLRSQRLYIHAQYARCFELTTRTAYYATFVASIVLLLNTQWAWIAVASMFTARLGLQILVFAKAQKRLKEQGLLFTSLWWDIFAPIAYLPIVILSKRERRLK